MMPIASVQEKAVIDMMRKSGPCCLDDLVAKLPSLSWGEVFVAVDRMSRDGRLLLRQRGYSSYQISLPLEFTSPNTPSRQEEMHVGPLLPRDLHMKGTDRITPVR